METVVAVEYGERNKLENSSATVITCSDYSKQIADPVVYKLARVVGEGIYIPATDDDMKAEDSIDHRSSLHFVLDNSETAVCSSNYDTFGQEFMPIDCELEGLFSGVFHYYFLMAPLFVAIFWFLLLLCYLSFIALLGFINVIALFLHFLTLCIPASRLSFLLSFKMLSRVALPIYASMSILVASTLLVHLNEKNITELLKFEEPSTQGERSDAAGDTIVDLGILNPKFEEVTWSDFDGQLDQSGFTKQSDPLLGHAESEPSTSTVCASWKPDFSTLKGDIYLDNLSVRELHATFKATFGRETSVKDKQWLKRRISMGLSNSCDVSATTFIIENNKLQKKDNVEDCNSEDKNHDKDYVTGLEGRNVSGDNILSVGHSQTIQMEGHFSGCSKTVDSATPKHHIAFDDDTQGNKRIRKPTRRYIEEVSESDYQEYSGRLVSSVKSSGNGQRTRVRPVHNIQPIRKPLVTRQDSLGGSGIEIPYVSRIRRGRPRGNIMSLMILQPCGMRMAARLVKKTHDGNDPQSDDEIENQEHKAATATGWLQHPLIKESERNQQYSEQSADLNNNSDDGHMDSYADIDSDDNILTVPTAKGGIRRKHHRPWTLSEVAKLVEGVSRYGAGRWSEIKRIAFATCSHRTSVDLKDKWRNLLRASFAQLPAEKGVQNCKKHSSIPIPAPILLRVRALAETHSQVSPDLKAVKFRSNMNYMKSGYL
ncbi:hypothetical protein SSX86_021234 [Deinandra increscens subsp. villosa]|uniref:Uncharacterized protein n=1 Tax=Deinandra increscens subsp. villosa TaxID=3103831 RepID=A0AAP0CUA0_9ASTR